MTILASSGRIGSCWKFRFAPFLRMRNPASATSISLTVPTFRRLRRILSASLPACWLGSAWSTGRVKWPAERLATRALSYPPHRRRSRGLGDNVQSRSPAIGRNLMTRLPGGTAYFLCKQEVVSSERYLAMHDDVVARTKRDGAVVRRRIKRRDLKLTEVVDAEGADIDMVGAQN